MGLVQFDLRRQMGRFMRRRQHQWQDEDVDSERRRWYSRTVWIGF